jgi:hypothetical protein
MMEFQKASDRLNFFFSQHSWALLVDMPSDDSLDKHLQVLRTVCRHWGSKLEFPFQFNAAAFENTHEAHEYWLQKIPGLRLLHSRKQEIIIKDLYDGYDAQRANQLLRRKMKLDDSAWGHLIYFGGPRRTFICTFPEMPEPQALRHAIVKFHENHVAESILESETEQSQETLAYAEKHGLLELASPNTQILLNANNSESAVRLNQVMSGESLIPIRLNYVHCTIDFQELGKVHLSPVCFAIYCLYIDVAKGFTNKERGLEKYLNKAIENYGRIRGSDETKDGLSAIHNCFNTSDPDDKPFRDAVYKIKKEIIKALGNNNLAKQYYVTGQNGGIKRISIPREFVHYVNE